MSRSEMKNSRNPRPRKANSREKCRLLSAEEKSRIIEGLRVQMADMAPMAAARMVEMEAKGVTLPKEVRSFLRRISLEDKAYILASLKDRSKS